MSKFLFVVLLAASTLLSSMTSVPVSPAETVVRADTSAPPETTTSPGEVGGVSCDNYRGDDPTVPNYGDMICEYAPGGDLILRETLINQDVFLAFKKNMPGYIVGRVQALNFGDVKGFVTAIDIDHNGRSVDIEVYTETEPQQQMRMQVEVYGWKIQTGVEE